MLKSLPGSVSPACSLPITDVERLTNFYGRDNHVKIKYVRERKRIDYGKAHDDEYKFELYKEE